MKVLIFLATSLFLFACNNSSNTKNVSPAATTGSASPNQFASEISVTLTGGPNAGTYHVNSKDPTCSEDLTGKNSFGNQYSENGKKDNELSSLQLVINDIDSAKNGTNNFFLTIAFGSLLHGKSYIINSGSTAMSSKKSGSGKATLTSSGGTRTVVIEGKTDDGVGISATLKCNSLVNISGQ
jgi:hypothetical protein